MFVDIRAKRAMFCDPVFKAERYSYPVPTPGALDYALRSVYWKPQMRYVIKRICVVNEPKYGFDIQRFKVSKFPVGDDEAWQLRSENYLTDVHYGVEFEIELTGINPKENNTVKKHEAILKQRLQKGQYYKPPYLGTRECPCEISLAEEMPESKCGRFPIGYMLHHVSLDEEGIPSSTWYCPEMMDGIIDATNLHRKPKGNEEGYILKNLINLYDMHGEKLGMPPLGFEEAKISFEIILTPNGKIKSIKPLQLSSKNKPYPKMLCVPRAAVKTFNVVANFLWGNADYLFKNDEKRKAFVSKIREVAGDDPPKAILPVLRFYDAFDKKEAEKRLEEAGVQSENLVFRTDGAGEFILDDQEVKNCWNQWISRSAKGEKGFCVITGEKGAIAGKHPSVRGVYGAGSLARLICLDQETPSLSSYSYKGNSNAPISEAASQKIHLALNWLLQHDSNKFDTDKGTVVFWARNSLVLSESLAAVTGRKDAVFNKAMPKGEPFYLLELRGNGTGRICIKQYARLEYGNNSRNKLEEFLIKAECTTIRHDLLGQWDSGVTKPLREERSYLLGQLFATMEQAFIDALSEPFGATSKFYVQNFKLAQERPAAAFARLHGKARIYLQKSDYGVGKAYTDIIKRLDKFIIPYPDRQNAREKSLFLAGYENEKTTLTEARNERLSKVKKITENN